MNLSDFIEEIELAEASGGRMDKYVLNLLGALNGLAGEAESVAFTLTKVAKLLESGEQPATVSNAMKNVKIALRGFDRKRKNAESEIKSYMV